VIRTGTSTGDTVDATAEPVTEHVERRPLDGLPVWLDVAPARDASVRRWVEGILGWQVVDAPTARFVPPAVRLVDPAAAASAGGAAAGSGSAPAALAHPAGEGSPPAPHVGLPTVLLIDDAAPASTAAATLRLRPDAVVRWPEDRTVLAAAVADLLRHRAPATRAASVLTVGGLAGGVGTTTVALALAGLDGWAGHDTVVVTRGPGPTAPFVDAAGLGAADLWVRAVPLPGTERLRAVRLVGQLDDGAVAATSDPRVERVVLDLGVDADADVVVCRPDGAALAAADGVVASLVVVVGAGVVPAARLRRALPGRRLVHLPTSSRVARAAVRGRVPAGIPGSYLERLASVHRLVRP
jgi:hypothetical protein